MKYYFKYRFVLPSLKISGGVKEALKLANEIEKIGQGVDFVVMWVSPNELQIGAERVTYLSKFKTNARFALFQFPIIFARFFAQYFFSLRKAEQVGLKNKFVFTHYSTYPLSLIVPSNYRFFFVQDMEWNFIKNKLLSNLLKTFIIFVYKKGTVLTANQYLTGEMKKNGITVHAELPIWADQQFLAPSNITRSIDFVMVLRKGDQKRLDLYLEFIRIVNYQYKDWRLAIITPDSELADTLRPLIAECYLKPSIEEMRSVYARSKFFLLLSDHEGFGLPPLEAMGAGCVPICRDAGGIHAYMSGDLKQFVLPLSFDIQQITQFANNQIIHNKWIEFSDLAKNIFLSGLTKSNERSKNLSEFISLKE